MQTATRHALRQQGLAFCVLALVFVLLTAIFPVWNSALETAVLATLIFFLGLPHGAFDVIFAQRLFRLVSLGQWAVFCLAYVALAAAVVGFWWLLPSVFLTAFLLVSAFHFSGDLDVGTPAVLRFWYAASMLIFPAWFHEADVARLFGALVAGDFAGQMAGVLHSIALPWCAGLGITLVSFAVFFCLMHSARHALRTRAYAAELAWVELLKKAIAPMVVCALAAAVLWPSMKGLTLDTAIVRILFVALAALTVPHMVLIERVRLSGWQNGSSSKTPGL